MTAQRQLISNVVQPISFLLSEFLCQQSQITLTSLNRDAVQMYPRSLIGKQAASKQKAATRDAALRLVMQQWQSDFSQGPRGTFKAFMNAKRFQLRLSWTQRCMRAALFRPSCNWKFCINVFVAGTFGRLNGIVVNIQQNQHGLLLHVNTVSGNQVQIYMHQIATPLQVVQNHRSKRAQ
jgi:hypothetical protein